MKILEMKLTNSNNGGLLAQFNASIHGILIRGFALQRVESGAIHLLMPLANVADAASSAKTVQIEDVDLKIAVRERAIQIYKVLADEPEEAGLAVRAIA